MYFSSAEATSRLGLEEVLSIVFSSKVPTYREIANQLLNWMKRTSLEKGRMPVQYVDSTELSRFIVENIGRNRKVTVYRVIFEFLVPYGFVDYRPSDGTYVLSKEFTDALRRIGEAYSRWYRSA